MATVLEVREGYLATERIIEVAPTPEAARLAGRELARIHAAGAEAFGCPPPGWTGRNYIGTQEQACVPVDNFAEFYVNQRLLPFLAAARDRGTVSDSSVVERACEAILDCKWEVAPARIHGDLWAGNLLFGAQGPVFIDPAAHGGHPDTDLGMLHLFGAPYLREIYAGYSELRGFDEALIPVHQLHPLAVHAVTHGPGYGQELIRCARRVLSIL